MVPVPGGGIMFPPGVDGGCINEPLSPVVGGGIEPIEPELLLGGGGGGGGMPPSAWASRVAMFRVFVIPSTAFPRGDIPND